MHQEKSWRGIRAVVVVALLGAMLVLGGCEAMLGAVVDGMLDSDDDFGGSTSMSDGCHHHRHH